jgi:peptide/nickel transport system permease protein
MMLSRPQKPALVAGVLLTGLFLTMALVALLWTPYDPTALAIADKLEPPNRQHWLGTDQLGRDVLSMIMAGAKASVGVAVLSVLIGLGAGVPLGLAAAARPGVFDEVLMRANDVAFAFPALLSAILLAAVLGPGAIDAIAALGLFNVPVFARVTRAAALALWTRDFSAAARVAGKSAVAISWEHILPNARVLLAVQATIQLSVGVTAEAGFAYLGLGVQPPTPSWGRMLGDAQTLTALAPTLAVFPGLAVALFVLGLNLLGAGLKPGRER